MTVWLMSISGSSLRNMFYFCSTLNQSCPLKLSEGFTVLDEFNTCFYRVFSKHSSNFYLISVIDYLSMLLINSSFFFKIACHFFILVNGFLNQEIIHYSILPALFWVSCHRFYNLYVYPCGVIFTTIPRL